MPGIDMASSLDDAIQDAEAIVLLVKHTEFSKFNPLEIAKKTSARIVIDTVNAWNKEDWENAGFTLFRLGNNKSKIANRK